MSLAEIQAELRGYPPGRQGDVIVLCLRAEPIARD
jgi:hypothetical protein